MNRVTVNLVVLALIVALLNRISAQNNWHDYFATKLSYHHVHHLDGNIPSDQESTEALTDNTASPHQHKEGFDTQKHRHCHTHGNVHSFGEVLLFTTENYAMLFASISKGTIFLKSDDLVLAIPSTNHFRPPIPA